MSGLPHQVQRKMDIVIDSARSLSIDYQETQMPKIHGVYIKVPGLRSHRYAKVSIVDVIRVSVKRHLWRVEIQEQINWLCKDADDE